jgi:hypothetical protein
VAAAILLLHLPSNSRAAQQLLSVATRMPVPSQEAEAQPYMEEVS